MTRGATTNLRLDERDCALVKPDPPSAGTAKRDDFAARFCRARTDYGVDNNQAKQGLFSQVEGAQSCLVIAGMDPDRQAMRDISFGEYF